MLSLNQNDDAVLDSDSPKRRRFEMYLKINKKPNEVISVLLRPNDVVLVVSCRKQEPLFLHSRHRKKNEKMKKNEGKKKKKKKREKKGKESRRHTCSNS